MTPTGNKTGMERLLLAIQELSLAHDLQGVMQIVRTVARELTGADGATFILRKDNQCYYADEDAIGPLWKGQQFPMDRCISGWAMLHREPAIIEDIYHDDRVPANLYEPTFVKSLAMVPIRAIDPIGAIGNYWAKKHLPTTEEVHLLQALADIIAVTLENIKVHDELEQRVRDRTAELEASNKELETFSYSVSHDLRAPLRKLGYFSEMLLDSYSAQIDETGRGWLNKLTGSVREMEQLIEILLQFSRIGKTVPYKTIVPVKIMVTELSQNSKEQESKRNIFFTIKELPDVLADMGLLKQVWVNLISNAVKYTGQKDTALIEIGAETTEDHIIYYIKDNGTGFDMKYYDKLFTAFQRLHSRNDFEGSGIGLAIVQRIIANHGGRVWAESIQGEGACFYFELPKNQV